MTFRINRVYTRSGDDGRTALAGGERLSKSDLRIAAYGEIDELNSALGWGKEELTPHCQALKPVIELLQQELFDLGAELATPAAKRSDQTKGITAEQVSRLELLCDYFGESLPELTSFILPGGSKLCAVLHMARTIARRAERTMVSFRDSIKSEEQGRAEVRSELLQYVNRLSDFLFVAARWSLAQEGRSAPLWEPHAKRSLPEFIKFK